MKIEQNWTIFYLIFKPFCWKNSSFSCQMRAIALFWNENPIQFDFEMKPEFTWNEPILGNISWKLIKNCWPKVHPRRKIELNSAKYGLKSGFHEFPENAKIPPFSQLSGVEHYKNWMKLKDVGGTLCVGFSLTKFEKIQIRNSTFSRVHVYSVVHSMLQCSAWTLHPTP